jgi:hypothetical protein
MLRGGEVPARVALDSLQALPQGVVPKCRK